MSIPIDPFGKRLVDAFSRPSDWRTPGGIARTTGLPVGEVRDYLSHHADMFDTSAIRPSGEPLFSLKPTFLPNVPGI